VVSVDETGEREFSFYRDPGADTQLTEDEAVTAVKALSGKDGSGASILHIGSLSMTTSPAREATLAAIKTAQENGMLISYDPNYRGALWDSEERAIEEMKKLLPDADILKVSDEELVMLTGTSDLEAGSKALADYGVKLVMVTLGGDGVFARFGDITAKVPGFSVKVADTNGAGDTFLGAVLCQIVARPEKLDGIGMDELVKIVRYANKAASITCSRSGAIPAMPTADEIGHME
jgi:fructokinase